MKFVTKNKIKIKNNDKSLDSFLMMEQRKY